MKEGQPRAIKKSPEAKIADSKNLDKAQEARKRVNAERDEDTILSANMTRESADASEVLIAPRLEAILHGNEGSRESRARLVTLVGRAEKLFGKGVTPAEPKEKDDEKPLEKSMKERIADETKAMRAIERAYVRKYNEFYDRNGEMWGRLKDFIGTNETRKLDQLRSEFVASRAHLAKLLEEKKAAEIQDINDEYRKRIGAVHNSVMDPSKAERVRTREQELYTKSKDRIGKIEQKYADKLNAIQTELIAERVKAEKDNLSPHKQQVLNKFSNWFSKKKELLSKSTFEQRLAAGLGIFAVGSGATTAEMVDIHNHVKPERQAVAEQKVENHANERPSVTVINGAHFELKDGQGAGEMFQAAQRGLEHIDALKDTEFAKTFLHRDPSMLAHKLGFPANNYEGIMRPGDSLKFNGTQLEFHRGDKTLVLIEINKDGSVTTVSNPDKVREFIDEQRATHHHEQAHIATSHVSEKAYKMNKPTVKYHTEAVPTPKISKSKAPTPAPHFAGSSPLNKGSITKAPEAKPARAKITESPNGALNKFGVTIDENTSHVYKDSQGRYIAFGGDPDRLEKKAKEYAAKNNVTVLYDSPYPVIDESNPRNAKIIHSMSAFKPSANGGNPEYVYEWAKENPNEHIEVGSNDFRSLVD